MSGNGCCSPGTMAREGAPAGEGGVVCESDPRGRMVRLEGGTFLMGTDAPDAFPQDGEGPVREVAVAPFWIDRVPVTNALFAEFVAATGYRTEAEGFGWSFVFWAHVPAARYRELVTDTVEAAPWWCRVEGAYWRAPEGPGSGVEGRGDHPVVHVSWNDAMAYCAWSGQRLPTEAEWEYAARGGLVQKLYPWGDKLRPDGEHRCNIWQGEFPRVDTAEDGYSGTCPVEAFAANGFGLYSMTGNTWEWCADGGEAKVMKGGSFLCHKSYCNRYRVAARSSNTPDSSTSHMGFRCVVGG